MNKAPVRGWIKKGIGASKGVDGLSHFIGDYALSVTMTLPDSRHILLVLLFTFCQVIGTMCVIPDVSMAMDTPVLMEEGMSCPMDGTIMCPPSITSSSERQVKHIAVAQIDDTAVSLVPVTIFAVFSSLMLWAWSSAYSLVPISISSSSVLRI